MDDQADEALVRIALERGHITLEEVEGCREAQERIARTGAHRALLDIIQDRGLLAEDEVADIRRAALDEGIKPRVGAYQLEERLGKGASGGVYRARHTHTGEVYAVKILRLEHTEDPRYLQRFEQELAVIRQLDHPNVVRGYEGGWGAGFRYFVMEFIEGETLLQIVRRKGALSQRVSAKIGERLASAVEYLAGRKVVHGDIKPNNVMLSSKGLIKLSDWGSARLSGYRMERGRRELFLATPKYMAPEFILRGATIDPRADLYSIGTTLFFLVTARAPFQGESAKELGLKIIRDDPPTVRGLGAQVSQEFEDLIQALLAKKPGDRPQHPAELRERFKALAG